MTAVAFLFILSPWERIEVRVFCVCDDPHPSLSRKRARVKSFG